MKIRNAFTMIELVFVMVVMGILAKFGVEFLARAYEGFIFSSTNNKLMSNSATAVEFIANRLQYRLKESVIVRISPSEPAIPLANAVADDYVVFEWIPEDIDGFRGATAPLWSGIMDVDAGGGNTLFSPETDTNALNTLITTLSYGGSDINDSALYFMGANNIPDTFGWDIAITNQSAAMHPIESDGTPNQYYASTDSNMTVTNFIGTHIYEYYKFAWTANAIVIERDTATNKNRLMFYYDYQPWNGDKFDNGKSSILMEDISTFQAMSLGSIIKIQVCAKSDLIEEYSLCKEKTVY